MENKDLKTNKEEKNLVLVIENASTELKKILNDALMFGYPKSYTKSLVNELIAKTSQELKEMEAPDDIIKSTEISIKQSFLRQYTFMLSVLEKRKKEDKTGIISLTLKKLKSNKPYQIETGKGIIVDTIDGVNIFNASINNLREYMTEVESAAGARYVDYANMVQETIVEVGDAIGDGTLTEVDSLGRHKSIRNMAEIYVRYNLIVDDVKKMSKDTKFVMGSSHPNASERCSYWQGKIFELDIDVASREMGEFDKKHPPTPKVIGHLPNGEPYYSLKEACENGFLSYNCQHRLVKYYEGMKAPQYNFLDDDIIAKRDVTTTQRVLENRVRQYKARTKISNAGVKLNRKTTYLQQVNGNWYWFKDGSNTGVMASEHTLELKTMPRYQKHRFTQHNYNNIMANYWEDTYTDFSRTNKAPIYKWRLRITETERMVRDL